MFYTNSLAQKKFSPIWIMLKLDVEPEHIDVQYFFINLIY